MEIKILHWYYDLMNLYGEYANIYILEKYLKRKCDKISIDKKSIDDDVDLSEYDLIYIGSGTEKNQLVVLEDMRKYITDIEKVIDNNKIILATGNAWEIFGREINLIDDTKIDALQIFDYTVTRKNDRIISDSIYTTECIDKEIIVSINKMGVVYNADTPLFKVKYGIGNNDVDKMEGIINNNFYGTYAIGPLLIKNPYFLEYIIKKIYKNKGLEFEKIEIDEYELNAYKITLENLKKVYENK